MGRIGDNPRREHVIPETRPVRTTPAPVTPTPRRPAPSPAKPVTPAVPA